jgi:hypothetical protein
MDGPFCISVSAVLYFSAIMWDYDDELEASKCIFSSLFLLVFFFVTLANIMWACDVLVVISSLISIEITPYLRKMWYEISYTNTSHLVTAVSIASLLPSLLMVVPDCINCSLSYRQKVKFVVRCIQPLRPAECQADVLVTATDSQSVSRSVINTLTVCKDTCR